MFVFQNNPKKQNMLFCLVSNVKIQLKTVYSIKYSLSIWSEIIRFQKTCRFWGDLNFLLGAVLVMTITKTSSNFIYIRTARRSNIYKLTLQCKRLTDPWETLVSINDPIMFSGYFSLFSSWLVWYSGCGVLCDFIYCFMFCVVVWTLLLMDTI